MKSDPQQKLPMVWMNRQQVTILRGKSKGRRDPAQVNRADRQELPQRKEHTKNEFEIGSSVEMCGWTLRVCHTE